MIRERAAPPGITPETVLASLTMVLYAEGPAIAHAGAGARSLICWVVMDEDLPIVEFATPGPLRERLIGAIRSGRKASTSSLLRQYEVDGEPLPVVGGRGVVIDSAGQPQFVIQTVDLEIVPLCEVPLAHAIAEGEGYESVNAWRAAHIAFWRSNETRSALGSGFVIDESTPVVLERFAVVR